MASSSSEECVSVTLFAEEMLKCLLIDSNIPWNPSWGFQTETSVSIDELLREVLPDLNACRGLISESVREASRRFQSVVLEKVSDICEDSDESTFVLLPSLIAVGETHHCFFTCMAIAKDICIRFLDEERSHLIDDVLEAVVYFMKDMTVYNPTLLRISIEKYMMASNSFEECVCVKLFAEEMLKCLLMDSNITWNPSWSFQKEPCVSIDCVTTKVLENLNSCYGLISKCISIVFRRDRSTVVDEVSYVLAFSSNEDMLSKSLIAVGESNQCFFTFMAIARDICISFHREEKSHLIADVLKAVVYFMKDMTVSHPELFISAALDFITRYGP